MVKKGDIFMSKDDRQRINNENRWSLMYESEYGHTKKYSATNGRIKEDTIDPIIPLPALVADINSDLLFGEFPLFETDNDAMNDTINGWVRENKFESETLEASAYTNALGTMFLYSFAYEKKAYYQYLKPNNMVWEDDKFGLTNVKVFESMEISADKKSITYEVQEHSFNYDEKAPSPYFDDNRKYVYEEYTVTVQSNDYKIKHIEYGKTAQFNQDFIPIVKIVNIGMSGQKEGKSEYKGKEQLFAEVDHRLDCINEVLTEHADPWTAVPRGLLDEYGNFDRSKGKMYEKMAGANNDGIDIRSWDASLDSSFNAIKMMIKMIFLTSRISSPIAGLDDAGDSVESGKALKWRSISTSAMTTRKRKYWSDSFREFFRQQSILGEQLKGLDITTLNMIWKDGLPMDSESILEGIIEQINAGIMSKYKGMRISQEISDDEAKEEQARIIQEGEQQAKIQASAVRVTI